HTHQELGTVSLDTVRYELRESKRVLEEELSHKIRWFSYPFGERHQFPADRLPLVAEAGYEGCVSAFGGFIHPGADSRMLPRETVPSYSSLTLEVRLTGCLNWLYGLREFLKTPPPLLQ